MSALPPLRVTQISTNDLKGGAAICAHRLNEALAATGIRSRMMVAQRFSANPDTVEFNPLAPAPSVLGRIFFRLGRRFQRPSVKKAGAYFSPDWTVAGRRLMSQLPPSDIVNLHWVADFLDYRVLPRLTERVPVVWTFHDMNAFTGGCHYSGSCDRYLDRCGSCPQLRTSHGPDDMTRRALLRKERIFERISRSRLTVVCPSRWLAAAAKGSRLFRHFDVRTIPSGIDVGEYHPIERTNARERLGLPPRARIALFVADFVNDRRKGFALLLEAVAAIRDIPGLLLVTIGRGETASLGDPAFRHLGPLAGGEALSAAYSAADVFVVPSLQDNFPNTVLESMACGTPVVGFASGGIAESVGDGRTGLLAPTGDARALARNLRRALEDEPLRLRLGGRARAAAEMDYSMTLQAERYANLYQELLEAGPERGMAASAAAARSWEGEVF